MQLFRQRRGDVLIGDDFNVDAVTARFRALDSFVKFAACRDTRRQPAVAPERLWELVIVPSSNVVIATFRVFAERSLDVVAIIIKDEDDGFQPKAVELADFLRRQLVRAVTSDKEEALARRCQCRAKSGGRCPSD